MNKQLTLIFILIFSLSVFSQKNNQIKKYNINDKIDSLNRSELNQNLKIEKLNKLVNFKTDSLEKELLYFKVKEDYYSTALSDQANRFTLIISGILALLALLSFGLFKNEVSKIRLETDKKLSKHKKEIKKYKKQLLETNTDLKSAKGNLSTAIAKHFEKEKDFAHSFFYYVAAAKGHGESANEKANPEEASETNYAVCLSNIRLAMDSLDKIELEEDIETLKIKPELTQTYMDDVSKIENVEVRNKIAEVRVKFLKLIE
tara:strand:+ start:617 stop:1396 length:780 start_codon:yes stop_codon:yes gene_type:complete